MRVLADLTQKPRRAQKLGTTVLVREGEFPLSSTQTADTGRWNRLSFPERVPTTPPVVSMRFSGGRRQHQAHRNQVRLYSPQHQRGVQTVFVIIDRETGQVLARVRGGAAHCEIEAEKLARSQGGVLADLKVVFEGEFL